MATKERVRRKIDLLFTKQVPQVGVGFSFFSWRTVPFHQVLVTEVGPGFPVSISL